MKNRLSLVLSLVLLFSTSLLTAQEALKATHSEGAYYNAQQQPSSKEEAVFVSTSTHYANGLVIRHKDQLVDTEKNYKFYYQKENDEYEWKTLDPEKGLISSKKKTLSYCPDETIKATGVVDWGAPEDYFFDLLQFYMKREKRRLVEMKVKEVGSVMIRVTFDDQGYLQNTCVVEGKNKLMDEEAFRIGNTLHRVELMTQPEEISHVIPIFFKKN